MKNVGLSRGHFLLNCRPVIWILSSVLYSTGCHARVLERKKQTVKQSLYRRIGFLKAEAPRFRDNRHKKAARLSTLDTDRLYAPGNIPATYLC